jgi:hypothetical protein
MGTKDWVREDSGKANLYQKISLDKGNNSPATIEVNNPTDFQIESESLPNGKKSTVLRLEVQLAWNGGVQISMNHPKIWN